MKHNALHILIIALAAGLPACSTVGGGKVRIGDTPARRIAKDPSIPGKGVEGQCAPFASALHRKFQAAGIRSKVVTFGYESLNLPLTSRQPSSGAHAAVVYEDSGRTYMMDNQSWMPTWVADGSPVAMAQQFAGMDIRVDRAAVR